MTSKTNEVHVLFTPSGLRGRVPAGTTILQAAQRLAVDIESVCGGQGKCRHCQVLPQYGDFPKQGVVSRIENLSEFAEVEIIQQQKNWLGKGLRLACQTRILGDIVIDVPEQSQQHKQHIAKAVTAFDIQVQPAVRLYTISLPEPNMKEPMSDNRRMQIELIHGYDLPVLDCEPSQLRLLQKALGKSNRTITVAIYQYQKIIAIWPGEKKKIYGLAIDLGSTTIAAQLCDMNNGAVVATADMMNPQIRFGEDLMSRVSYVMMNDDGADEMTRVVREAFNELAKRAVRAAGIEIDDILDITVVANPIMHHLFLGIDPTPLGTAPFTLATDQMINLRAAEIDINLHAETRICILPCIAGHIGADTAGMILAERPDLAEENRLLVDIGTNAEIVLANKYRLMAASSPTGPAFEGAQISSGQRAAPGAIEHVRINKETLEPVFQVIGREGWSDQEKFLKNSSRVGITGICGSGIIEVIAEMFLSGIIDRDGLIGPVAERDSSRIVQDGRTWSYILQENSQHRDKSIRVTQNDVRAVQLAKAALHAGIRLLLDRMGIEKADRISLAGAFGSHIDVKYAMILGLIPDCELDKTGSVGNSAGTGARIALLNYPSRIEIGEVLPKVEKIETAIEGKFQEYFVDAMLIPHKTESYTALSRVVTFPAEKIRSGGKSGNRRRGKHRGKLKG